MSNSNTIPEKTFAEKMRQHMRNNRIAKGELSRITGISSKRIHMLYNGGDEPTLTEKILIFNIILCL